MSREVTIFEKVGFTGRSQTRAVGRYDSKQLAIGDHVLSSLKVPAGMEAILYEDSQFGGRKIAFAGDTSNVGDFNDKTSSIEVREKPPARAAQGVTIFTDPSFAGKSVTLGVGHHNLAALAIERPGLVLLPRRWMYTNA